MAESGVKQIDSANYIFSMIKDFIGRNTEITLLQETYQSRTSEMVAIIGRRRVGKTHLVRHVFDSHFDFIMTGAQHTPTPLQLSNFFSKLVAVHPAFKKKNAPVNWLEAFQLLKEYLLRKKTKQKKVLFFDELPWIASARSGFLEALGYFWNDWAAHNRVLIVICGSAASWMVSQVVHNKGSLHNRYTKLIHLQPFNLSETAFFLQSRKIVLNHYQVIQLYMVTGGVPHYLKEIKKGQSVAQNIDRLCFTPHGLLKEEFTNLYTSLYDDPGLHMSIIRALASKWVGLTRSQLIRITGMNDGGSITRILSELEQSGFITPILPFNKKKKDILYRLTDHYSLFYLKFMEGKRKTGEGNFISLSQTVTWKAWSGYAFENICFMHLPQLKASLGIAAVYTEVSSYIEKGGTGKQGMQADMLVNRADNIVNLCEMKFYDAPFTITKKYAGELRNKREAIRKAAPPKKVVFITMVTCFGLQENSYATELIQQQVKAEELFK